MSSDEEIFILAVKNCLDSPKNDNEKMDWITFLYFFRNSYFRTYSMNFMGDMLKRILNISQVEDINSGVEYSVHDWCLKLYSY